MENLISYFALRELKRRIQIFYPGYCARLFQIWRRSETGDSLRESEARSLTSSKILDTLANERRYCKSTVWLPKPSYVVECWFGFAVQRPHPKTAETQSNRFSRKGGSEEPSSEGIGRRHRLSWSFNSFRTSTAGLSSGQLSRSTRPALAHITLHTSYPVQRYSGSALDPGGLPPAAGPEYACLQPACSQAFSG